jgi:hypothetical protein
MPVQYLNEAMTASFQIPSNSSSIIILSSNTVKSHSVSLNN